jgi:hypothetical protein
VAVQRRVLRGRAGHCQERLKCPLLGAVTGAWWCGYFPFRRGHLKDRVPRVGCVLRTGLCVADWLLVHVPLLLGRRGGYTCHVFPLCVTSLLGPLAGERRARAHAPIPPSRRSVSPQSPPTQFFSPLFVPKCPNVIKVYSVEGCGGCGAREWWAGCGASKHRLHHSRLPAPRRAPCRHVGMVGWRCPNPTRGALATLPWPVGLWPRLRANDHPSLSRGPGAWSAIPHFHQPPAHPMNTRPALPHASIMISRNAIPFARMAHRHHRVGPSEFPLECCTLGQHFHCPPTKAKRRNDRR